MTDDEKNIQAIIESGELEKYSPEFFKLNGRIGGKKGKKFKGKTREEISEHMRWVRSHRQ